MDRTKIGYLVGGGLKENFQGEAHRFAAGDSGGGVCGDSERGSGIIMGS